MGQELIFDCNTILERPRGLTFDDVLLVPQYSEISSRRNPNLKSRVTKKHNLDIPIVAANMDTVSGKDMCFAMARLGGLAILHRFMSPEEQVDSMKEIISYIKTNKLSVPSACSIGVKEEGIRRADLLADIGSVFYIWKFFYLFYFGEFFCRAFQRFCFGY